MIEPGEFVVVLGRNGSGKSTLVRLIDGFLLPEQGQVLVDGLDLADPNARVAVRQRVGLLFSNPDNQLVSSVVEEDVAFGPENLGLPPPEIENRVQSALAQVRMEDYRAYPPHLLSGGQKQRIAIAGVLALQPRYLMLDEPTSMLDPAGRDEVLETVIRLNRETGAGVLWVTHFTEEALAAHRVIVLDQGRIVMNGPPEAILGRVEELYALGLEPPDSVLLARELRRRGIQVSDGLSADGLLDELIKLAAAGHREKG